MPNLRSNRQSRTSNKFAMLRLKSTIMPTGCANLKCRSNLKTRTKSPMRSTINTCPTGMTAKRSRLSVYKVKLSASSRLPTPWTCNREIENQLRTARDRRPLNCRKSKPSTKTQRVALAERGGSRATLGSNSVMKRSSPRPVTQPGLLRKTPRKAMKHTFRATSLS